MLKRIGARGTVRLPQRSQKTLNKLHKSSVQVRHSCIWEISDAGHLSIVGLLSFVLARVRLTVLVLQTLTGRRFKTCANYNIAGCSAGGCPMRRFYSSSSTGQAVQPYEIRLGVHSSPTSMERACICCHQSPAKIEKAEGARQCVKFLSLLRNGALW